VLFLLPLTGLALGAFARTAYVFPDDKGKKKMFRSASKGRIFTLQTENPASRFSWSTASRWRRYIHCSLTGSLR